MERPEPLDDLEMANLYETARGHLRWERLEEAKAVAERILRATPESTSVHELRGDVLLALGDREGAAEAFKHALELEPVNADAEYKYVQMLLELQGAAEQREALASGDLTRFRGATSKEPGTAAARSALFPGLGQLYNGEYEKGVAFAVLGFVLYIAAGNKAFAWLQPGEPVSPIVSMVGWVGVLGGLLVYSYSIKDAYTSGQRIAAYQNQVGVRIPPKEADS